MTQTADKKQGKLFVISGPSGSGKSTLCRLAVQKTDAQLSVSATTRQKSDQETEGKDYFFLTEAQFKEKINQGQFLEYAQVFDHYYGTPDEPVQESLKQGKTVILEIDVQGANQVFAKSQIATGILILPPSDEELKNRLCSRKRDTEEIIEKRLAKAHKEIDIAKQSGRFIHTIVNDNLEDALEELIAILQK